MTGAGRRRGVGGGGFRYGKTETVLRLAMALQGTAEGISIPGIMQEFGVGRRTAERMRDAVERVFPQMEQANPGELPKRWRLPSGSLSRLVGFDAPELAAVATAAAQAERAGAVDLAARLRSVERKLLAGQRQGDKARLATDLEGLVEAEGIAMRPGPRPQIAPAVVAALREAILGYRKVRIDYAFRGSGKAGQAVVHPYGFLQGRRHYLVAWSEHEKSRDFRLFDLSRIGAASPLDEGFQRRRGFSLRAFAERSFGVFQEDPIETTWRFAPEAAEEAAEYTFHPTQKLRRIKDGSLEVTFRAAGLREMCWHLFEWGDRVRVVSPARLRRMYADLLGVALRIGAARGRRRTVADR